MVDDNTPKMVKPSTVWISNLYVGVYPNQTFTSPDGETSLHQLPAAKIKITSEELEEKEIWLEREDAVEIASLLIRGFHLKLSELFTEMSRQIDEEAKKEER